MKQLNLMNLFILFLSLQLACNSSQPGCTDPLAVNFDSSATEEDHSCFYDTVFINPLWSVELSEQINETSGLILWNEVLLTMNDNSDTRLYALDKVSGEIVGDYLIPGVVNRDWEELDQDEEFIYVGDIGNNRGSRKDLHILRIDKLSLSSGDPAIDTIWFSFSDQQNYITEGQQETEFDCEAFVVTADSIYLFTKQWLSGHTTQYAMPKLPGTYIAQKRSTFDTRGQVTGAVLIESSGILILSGYSGLIQPFLFLFSDYQGLDFFSGVSQRVNLPLPFHQLEAVTSDDGIRCYISNESSAYGQAIKIPQKLHLVDLSELLGK